MGSALQFVQFEHRKRVLEAHRVVAVEILSVAALGCEGEELLPDVVHALLSMTQTLCGNVVNGHGLSLRFPETLQNLLQARHLEVGELFLFGCHGSDQDRDRVLVFLPVVNEFEGIEADFRRFVELQEVAVQLFIELFVGLARVDHPDLRTFR